jgi:adenine deaminase
VIDQRYRWKHKHLREHVAVLDGKCSPTILLKNATYLNQVFRKWMKANIWIYEDRIVYVGDRLPDNMTNCEVIDCTEYKLVPGYIEPHTHPHLLYNPHSLANYASKFGTTTLINDNLMLAVNLSLENAFSFLSEMKAIPVSMYWWCRFDGQTELIDQNSTFSHANIKAWLEHDCVLQGGELTGWPKLLDGDDLLLHWIQETKKLKKQIEGHFPGASEKTLAKMKLLGADCDHESMTGQDVYNRLLQGYMVTLRHSAIRPDLPKLLTEIHELGIDFYDRFMFTTDGAPASFYKDGIIDAMIRIAIEHKVPVIDAYNMATINVARYYNIDYLHGSIALGRVANINFLTDEKDPTPVSVLAKGRWVKLDGKEVEVEQTFKWDELGLDQLAIDFDLTWDDMQFSMPFGIKMENAVITKPYSISLDCSMDELSHEHDECFFMLLDRHGNWRINTLLKGFANRLSGLVSSFSNTGDIILIGKSKKDMFTAFNRMKEMGGGIVCCENGEIKQEIPLRLKGIMSDKKVDDLIVEENQLDDYLRDCGYQYCDPIHSMLFLSATHLPYIRVTQQGLYDVMNKMILFPMIMR